MTQYRYAATDLITGDVLAGSIPLNVQSFGVQLNGSGSLTGSLNLSEMPGNNQPFIEALECRRAHLWALADGYPVWDGIVWDWPDMTRAQGNLPVSAQTIDSVFAKRLIMATLSYPGVDIFKVFIDLVKYGVSLRSPYITSLSPVQGPPSALVESAAAVAGLVMPQGAAATAGVPWFANWLYSDLTPVSDAFSTLVQSGNLEYIFEAGEDPTGNLASFLRLGYTQVGRPWPEAGYSVTYPGNASDYGFQRTGSQGGNYLIGTAPPNGSSVQWQSQYPHGADLDDLRAGYPLMMATQSMQGSLVTQQSQVNQFADGQVQLKMSAMTLPVITIPGGVLPGPLDLRVGDTFEAAFTSPMHPPGPGGTPGWQGLVRLTGWTVTPPGPQQSESIQLTTVAVNPN